MSEGQARERRTLWIVDLEQHIEEHAKVAVWADADDRAMEAAEGDEIVEWVEEWSGDMEIDGSRHATGARPASEREQVEIGARADTPSNERQSTGEEGPAQARREGVRVGDAVHDPEAAAAWGYALGLAEARHGRAWAERLLEEACWVHADGDRLEVRLHPARGLIAEALGAAEVEAVLKRAWTVVHGEGAVLEVLEASAAGEAGRWRVRRAGDGAAQARAARAHALEATRALRERDTEQAGDDPRKAIDAAIAAGERVGATFMEAYERASGHRGVRIATGSVVALAGLLPAPWGEELAHAVGQAQSAVLDATNAVRAQRDAERERDALAPGSVQ